ncbi:NAD(P)-dependent dehydrogenase (short-subunit alcohol dehydrogenase family) [Hymenobacter luteus]|uniref:NAD(P)-dependent dehydrogenase (Short-subunit alcohol dehydrogenase family) n=2 Tax=Hymenobacter TaxID=89966 RepID=A0A7W9SZ38_9BACT|nr:MULTISPECIES: SDR family oxidoreductase [Hymenobacter]MBB4601221.1 NAD(P)-dependent dehydrogenase (short-subunit alcohol dehydrogenase family) [Hymenobacter latericoloratus]MBB6058572.1 NAD(P)-dependent dehydrogenase (short-subunit alcohol dehydrogenase family) [Hymenobacter luteus]
MAHIESFVSPHTQPNGQHQPGTFSLEGKLALVTGGGTGIGLEIARCMATAGATVIITGRREAVLQEAVADLGPSVHYLTNDVCALDTLEDLVEQIETTHGPLDILVNNAGINMKKPALDVTDEEFSRIIHTNLNAVFALTRVCARRMVERKSGVILMISSMAAYYGIDRVVAYAASKSAVEGMVKVLASEFSKHNVRVNAIAPGFIETEMSRTAMNSDPDRRDRAMRRTPMGKFGQPSDIGHAAVFLASEGARYITGASLPVDGGNSIGF